MTVSSLWIGRRAFGIRMLVPVYLVLIYGSAVAAAGAAFAAAPTLLMRLASLFVAPPVFVLTVLFVAGCLSRITLRRIVAGRYPRSLGHEIYGPRRLYALCWTSLYYFGPVYHSILAIPVLKRATFRLFGYRGNLEFTIYPDSWIRDLPMLDIGKGAYISNKATVSPNMCLRDGTIVVFPVCIGERALIGHLTMVAPGARIGPDAEIGVGAAVGLRTLIGAGSVVGHCAIVDHGARVGNNCLVGVGAYIGRKAVVHDGLSIPPASVIPARTVLRTQQDVEILCLARAPAPATISLSALSLTDLNDGQDVVMCGAE